MPMKRLAALLLLTAVPVIAAVAPAAEGETAVRIEVKDKTSIDFYHGKELSGRYHIGADAAKPYLWPLNAPNGKAVTRAWPMGAATPGEKLDHKHQKSLWFTHGDVIPEGVEIKKKSKNKSVKGVDFWDEDENHGRIVCVQVGEPLVKKNYGKVVTRNEWLSPDDFKVLDETRTLTLVNFGAAQLFVFDIDLHASNVAVTFGDTKEGAFGVRVAPSITEETGKGHLTNAEGKKGEGAKNNVNKDGCWGLKSAWCDYSGPVDGTTVGVAIFDAPTNPVAACWHARGYGLMAANPFGRDKAGFPAEKGKTDLVKLAKGEHLKLRYGVLLHDGDVKAGKVAEYYQKFVDWKE